MKKIFYFLSILMLSFSLSTIRGQVRSSQLKTFIDKDYKLADTSGPGLYAATGDILLKLITMDEYGGYKLVLLHRENGKLSKIAENESLLLSKEEQGTSGGNYPSLHNGVLSVNYGVGSGSASTEVSIEFTKAADGHYYFSNYTATSNSHGVENLNDRTQITPGKIGKLRFEDATMAMFEDPDGSKNEPYVASEDKGAENKAIEKLDKLVPEDFQMASYATGDLNQDGLAGDGVMVVCNKSAARAMVLLQQKDGRYKIIAQNEDLFSSADLFNANNFKVVVKNNYFTIEWRVEGDEGKFQKRYITFRYNESDKQILLHRLDVELYEGFNPAPTKVLMELTKKEFGLLRFKDMEALPGIYRFEPYISTLEGTITKRLIYGPPNYGQTPKKDEKSWLYILKTDYPVNVIGFQGSDTDSEIKSSNVMGIQDIQIYSLDKNIDFAGWLHKKIKVSGIFQQARSGHHYTKALLEVKKILN